MKKVLVLVVLLLLSLNVFAENDTLESKPGVTPDSFLWPIDVLFENVALGLTADSQKKVKKSLSFANERLQEMDVMKKKGNQKAVEKAEKSYQKLIIKTQKNIEKVDDISSISNLTDDIKNHNALAGYLGLSKAQEKVSNKSQGVPFKGLLPALQSKTNELAKKVDKDSDKEELKKLEKKIEELEKDLKKNKEKEKQNEKKSDSVEKYKLELAKNLFPNDGKGNYDLDDKEVISFLKEMFKLSSGLSEVEYNKLVKEGKKASAKEDLMVEGVKYPNLFKDLVLNPKKEDQKSNNIPEMVNKVKCTDSDGGKEYDKKGVTKRGLTKKEDRCETIFDDATKKKITVLKEYYCSADSIKEKIYQECKNGCENGACKLKLETLPAVIIPKVDPQKVDIEVIPLDLPPVCSDDDGGKDYNKKGTVTRGDVTETDSCSSETLLKEYFCENNDLKSEQYSCNNGCLSGSCKLKFSIIPDFFN